MASTPAVPLGTCPTKKPAAGPSATTEPSDTIYGWQVSLHTLTLEAIAWRSIRTLHLIRKRQARSHTPLEGTFDLAGLPLELFDKIVKNVRQDVLLETVVTHPFIGPSTPCACRSMENPKKTRKKNRISVQRKLWVTGPKAYEKPYARPIEEIRDPRMEAFLKPQLLNAGGACLTNEWHYHSLNHCQRLWSMRWESLSHNDFEAPRHFTSLSSIGIEPHPVAFTQENCHGQRRDSLAEYIRVMLRDAGHSAILLRDFWGAGILSSEPLTEFQFAHYFMRQPRLIIPRSFKISHTSNIGGKEWKHREVKVNRKTCLEIYRLSKSPLFELISSGRMLAWKK